MLVFFNEHSFSDTAGYTGYNKTFLICGLSKISYYRFISDHLTSTKFVPLNQFYVRQIFKLILPLFVDCNIEKVKCLY